MHEIIGEKAKEILDSIGDCTAQEGTAALISATIKWCETMMFLNENGHQEIDAVQAFAEMLVETRDKVDQIGVVWP